MAGSCAGSRLKLRTSQVAQPDFREWLIERLATTRYAQLIIGNESKLAKVAESVGVQPDTLREAMVLYRMRRIEEGRAPPRGDKKARSGHRQFRVWLPPELMPVWEAECAHRRMPAPTLIRSIVNEYLLGDKEPPGRGPHWVVRGERYPVTTKTRIEQRALIPPGAWLALSRRATSLGASPSSIVRALLCEVLEGKHMGVRAVECAAMYDDPARYNPGKRG